MTDVQILLPLSVVQGAENLTAEGIAEYLSNAVHFKIEADSHKARYNALVQRVQAAGRDLERILDEVDDGYEKVRALRNYARQMKEEGQSVREIP